MNREMPLLFFSLFAADQIGCRDGAEDGGKADNHGREDQNGHLQKGIWHFCLRCCDAPVLRGVAWRVLDPDQKNVRNCM